MAHPSARVTTETAAQVLASGRRRLHVQCRAFRHSYAGIPICGHGATVMLADLPPEMSLRRFALRLRCETCGAREALVTFSIADYYEDIGATSGVTYRSE